MFRTALLLLCCTQLSFAFSEESAKKLLGNDTLKINTTSEHGLEMYQHWIDKSISAVIAAVSQEKLKHLAKSRARAHEKCASRASTLQAHAQCATLLINEKSPAELTRRRRKKLRSPQLKKLKLKNGSKRHKMKLHADQQEDFRLRRRKREIIAQSSYKLMAADEKSTHFGRIAQSLTKTIRAFKKKEEPRSWKTIITSIKEKGKKLEKAKKVQDMLRGPFGKQPSEIKQPKQPKVIGRRRKLFGTKLRAGPTMARSNSTEIVSESSDEIVHLPQPRQMLDILMKNPKQLLSADKKKVEGADLPMKIVRESVRLGMSLTGHDVDNFDKKNVKLLSPRILSIVPEAEDEGAKDGHQQVSVLSPSLFSLHDEGSSSEKALSLASTNPDADDLLDLITEAAGINEAMEHAEKAIEEKSARVFNKAHGESVPVSNQNLTAVYGSDGERETKIFETLHSLYTEEQYRQFNRSGYALMTEEQRELMYGDNSPFASRTARRAADNVTHGDVRKTLHKVIGETAAGRLSFDIRQKDFVLSPILNSAIVANPVLASQALILSPVVMTSLILSPAIYGSVILSPWLFVPVILAPRLLSPIIVSPAMFAPIILSPLALDPLVLVPGVLNVLVLSPLVMCPFILAPQVFTPIILSPLALSPLVLSPMVGSPLVLSPFVLTPTVLSPMALTGFILSPYALSPNIQSPLVAATVFGSPSFLS